MKATNIRQSDLAARTLIVVGVIMILSSLLDFLVLSIPNQASQIFTRGWQIGVTTNIVDRGIIPMVGIALLLAGYWISSTAAGGQEAPKRILDLRLWALLLSCGLGLLYLLLFPLHLNNVSQAQSQTLEQINQQAAQAEEQLEARIQSEEFQNNIEQRKSQLKNQLTRLLEDEEFRNEARANNQIPDQVESLLEQSQEDQGVIDEFLNTQAEALPTQLLNRIRTRKQELEEQANSRTFRSSFQTGISSLLLAIGYIMIGWTGLKSMGILAGKGRRRSPAR